MPKNLVTLPVANPGVFGLNKQTSSGILPPGWATESINLVYDERGRFSARKGYQYINATAISGTPAVKTIHEYIDAGGNTLIIFSAGNAIYKDNGDGTITDISGTITTPTADNWKFQNFNGKCVGYQVGHAPIEIATVGSSFANAGGTQYNGSTALAAYGRLWTVYSNTLYYSDLLINSYAGGSSGSFDLATYWPDGMDSAVAIEEWNNYLIVFGKKSILVYAGADDPTSAMALADTISGVGCIARDSIQAVGDDLIFLSSDGVKTLGRVIQEKSLPLRDVTRNIRDYFVAYVDNETKTDIKSAYSFIEGFYLISLPTAGKMFCFDLKQVMQDGSLRATEWSFAPTALFSVTDRATYFGHAGYVSTYSGYVDLVESDGSGGSSYSSVFEGAWNDFGEEFRAVQKIPKRMSALMLGGTGTTPLLKWAFDYVDSFKSFVKTIPTEGSAEFNIAEFNVDEFAGSLTFNTLRAPMSGAGNVIKFGIEFEANGDIVALQRIDIQAKAGKTSV